MILATARTCDVDVSQPPPLPTLCSCGAGRCGWWVRIGTGVDNTEREGAIGGCGLEHKVCEDERVKD